MFAILFFRSLTTITGMESNSLKFTVSVTGMLMLKVINLPLRECLLNSITDKFPARISSCSNNAQFENLTYH